MKKIIGGLIILCLLVLGGGCTNDQSSSSSSSSAASANSDSTENPANETTNTGNESNAAIVYFSLTGTTEEIAYEIKTRTNGVLYPIETVDAYPEAYSDVLDVVRQQREDGELPELEPMDIDLTEYDTIYIGSPIWFSSSALPVQQWLTENDLSGKTIHPFFTSGSSGISTATSEIENLVENATVKEGIGITDDDTDDASELITTWLAAN